MTLARTQFNRQPAKEKKPKPGPRQRKCKCCGASFVPFGIQSWCGPECGYKLSQALLAKQKQKAQRVERAVDRKRKQDMKTIPQLKSDLQEVFNLCMRLEDEAAGHGCICCGKFPTAAAMAQLGGAWDCCHYRSRGSADHLRYNEDNAWRGLKDCNKWGHKDYRGGLIDRIGIERVEALESNQTGMKWTREWLLERKEHYAARVLALKKNRQ